MIELINCIGYLFKKIIFFIFEMEIIENVSIGSIIIYAIVIGAIIYIIFGKRREGK